jgi:hypothetical protein
MRKVNRVLLSTEEVMSAGVVRLTVNLSQGTVNKTDESRDEKSIQADPK